MFCLVYFFLGVRWVWFYELDNFTRNELNIFFGGGGGVLFWDFFGDLEFMI